MRRGARIEIQRAAHGTLGDAAAFSFLPPGKCWELLAMWSGGDER